MIERELGRGGMAVVYLAHDLRHDRPVALKVLLPELSRSLSSERFLREIRTAARLQHPHILSVYESGEAGKRVSGEAILWFTMPFVDGETLRARLEREKQLPVDDALRIAREVAEALDYAHRHGIVHRDIKPENILLNEGHALVADFGIARALSGEAGKQGSGEEERLTETGFSLGTPAYMSPEQATGQPVDARTDVYALGAVLYEMLAGEPPFTGPTPQAVIAKRFHSDPVPLRALRPPVSLTVERTVARALARIPTDRFASTAELARALEEPSAPTASTLVSPTLHHRPAPKGLLLLGLGILIGLGVLFAWTRSRQAEPAAENGIKRVAVLPFDNLAGSDKTYFAEGITDEIRGKLATVAGLQVTARTSSAQYARTSKRPEQIGRELGVDYLLTGTVRWDQTGNRSQVRVSPELIQTTSGSTRWQQSFDAPMTDVFQVQADVAERVARELGVALATGQRHHLEERPTKDLGAYDLYLKGRYAWHQRTAAGLEQARQLIEQAIALDPTFAPAHAALADVYTVLPLWSDLPPDQTYARAKAAALQALRLDSTLAGPYAALADVNAMYEWDWASAERNFKRSLALDPNNANTYHWYNGDFLQAVGRLDEAIAMARRARELDPLSFTINGGVGRALHAAGRQEESAAHLRGLLALDSTFPLINEWLGTTYLAQGRFADAVPLLQRATEAQANYSTPMALLGYALAKSGHRPQAEALRRELMNRQSREYVVPTSLALINLGLGDTAQAFTWLQRAARGHDPFIIYNFVNEPMLDPLKRDPRGAAILREMGLRQTR